MLKKKEVSILDVTIRDGSYAINYQYVPHQVSEVAAALSGAGIDYMEVSHGCGLGAAENMGLPSAASDADYVRAARKAGKRIKVGVIAGAAPATQRKDIDAVIDEVDFIRFAANCDNPGLVEANVAYAKKTAPKLKIFLQMMRSTRRPKKELVAAGRRAESMGVELVYLVDTAGHFIPEETADIVSTMTAKLSIGVGFHGHDNLCMAVANSMAAIEAGATSVDASLRGMGRGAGNAQLECLVSLMKRRGFAKKVDLNKLVEAAERIIAPIMPPRRGVDAVDLTTADANVDLYPLSLYEGIAFAAGVPLSKIIEALGKDPSVTEVDPDAVARALKKLRLDPSKVFSKAGLSFRR